MAKGGFYAVRDGRQTGIFTNWDECKAQVNGYNGAVYKKFKHENEAKAFMNIDVNATTSKDVSFDKPDKTPFYAVAVGNKPGIYHNWPTCFEQIKDHTDPKFIKCDTRAKAEQFIRGHTIKESYKEDLSGAFEPNKLKRGFEADDEKNGLPKRSRRDKPDIERNAKSPLQKDLKTFYGIKYKSGKSKIVNSWKECRKATYGAQGVVFKKFDNLLSAEFFTMEDEEDTPLSPRSKDQMTELFLQKNSEAILKRQKESKPTAVFCDGSFIPSHSGRSKAGFGVYFGPDDKRNIAQPLKDEPQNSFISEAKAIGYVLKHIWADIEEYEVGELEIMPKYSISSDSETMKNILHSYANHWTDADYKKKSDVPELKEIVTTFQKIRKFYHDNSPVFNDFKFEITWVKGHDGIEGNEEADRLAREGAEKSILP